jgi:hypothetical protein
VQRLPIELSAGFDRNERLAGRFHCSNAIMTTRWPPAVLADTCASPSL